MNLVEYHIVEIHEIRDVSRIREGFLIIDLTVNCYGNNIRTELYCSKEQWKEYKSKGFYLG